VIGALTVQSSQPGAFDQVAVAALQTMADQVAVAIDNARLFAESQAALETTRRAYGELSRQAWTELLRARAGWGYRYAHRSLAPAEGDWTPELLQAAQTGQSVQGNGAPEAGSTLAVPIKVRDQVIGALSFAKDTPQETWTTEEKTLLEGLTEQLGVALESARLYQDTQRRAAREQLTREITDKMRRATNIDNLLQITLQEMAAALGTYGGFVQLVSPSEAAPAAAQGVEARS
jgi:GAF domain-containing protein